MTPPYDRNNVFARILRGELPCSKVFEDEHVLAFRDIRPQAPVHVLVVPKGEYTSWADFSARAGDAEIAAWVRAAGQIARELGLEDTGYRLLANTGEDANQAVQPLHLHLFGGGALGRMIRVE